MVIRTRCNASFAAGFFRPSACECLTRWSGTAARRNAGFVVWVDWDEWEECLWGSREVAKNLEKQP